MGSLLCSDECSLLGSDDGSELGLLTYYLVQLTARYFVRKMVRRMVHYLFQMTARSVLGSFSVGELIRALVGAPVGELVQVGFEEGIPVGALEGGAERMKGPDIIWANV